MKRPRPPVAALVARVVRLRKVDLERATGDLAIGTMARLHVDTEALDATECSIVELKRGGFISGRQMVDLLRRHQRECRQRR
ncbi:hypothetical protein C8J30_11464 [Rhodobacter viridis]|uniref:Uncharacterized protein n=1 Tax=Rhodobacter viridis TaxID=1054202 RepID=A0A318TTF7_9RHOB|nr:hypothetical protein [Rhodobacter viridis]PYF08126.1 hypothetical protein C8J30_11464 [Rhodobacter viridis]